MFRYPFGLCAPEPVQASDMLLSRIPPAVLEHSLAQPLIFALQSFDQTLLAPNEVPEVAAPVANNEGRRAGRRGRAGKAAMGATRNDGAGTR
jgi:hypothetical protein